MSTLQDAVLAAFRQGDRNQNLGESASKNVSETERMVSATAGVLLVKLGLRRGLLSLSGLGLMGLGGALIKRGYTGQCGLYRKLRIDSTTPGPECR